MPDRHLYVMPQSKKSATRFETQFHAKYGRPEKNNKYMYIKMVRMAQWPADSPAAPLPMLAQSLVLSRGPPSDSHATLTWAPIKIVSAVFTRLMAHLHVLKIGSHWEAAVREFPSGMVVD